MIRFISTALVLAGLSIYSRAAIPIGAKILSGVNGANVRSRPGGKVLYTVFDTVGTIKSAIVEDVPISDGGTTRFDWYLIDWEWPANLDDGYSATTTFVYRAPRAPTPLGPGSSKEHQPEPVESSKVTFSWRPVDFIDGILTTDYLLNIRDLDAAGQPVSNFETPFTSHTLKLIPGHRYRWNLFARNGGDVGLTSQVSATLHISIAPCIEPPIPTELAVIQRSTALTLRWTDNATDETSYEIEKENLTRRASTTILIGPDYSSFDDSDYIIGDQLCYRVRVVNECGQSGYSSPICATATRLYRLEIDQTGLGEYSIAPSSIDTALSHNLFAKPHQYWFAEGTRIELRAMPNTDYHFSEWSGTHYSRNGTLAFPKRAAAESLSLSFVPAIAIPALDLRHAHSTPSMLTLPVVNQREWLTIIDATDDYERWHPVDVLESTLDEPDSTFSREIDHSKQMEIFGASSYPKVTPQPFLCFPLKHDLGGNPITVRNARVSAILDHGRYYVAEAQRNDGQIVALTGYSFPVLAESGWFAHELTGNLVQSDGALALIEPRLRETLPFSYVGTTRHGPSALQYDGHSGYDYSYPEKTKVYAAASGETVVDADLKDFGLLGLADDQMRRYHAIVIKHDNGYYSLYAHLSWIDSKFVDDTAGPSSWKPRKHSVTVGELIGHVGRFGADGYHLHFAVWRTDTDESRKPRLRVVDPYGAKALNGKEIDAGLWCEVDPDVQTTGRRN